MISTDSVCRRPLDRTPLRQLSRPAVLFAIVSATLFSPLSFTACAADGTWAADAAGNWGVAGNWVDDAIAGGVDATAVFSGTTTSRIINLGSTTRTLGYLDLAGSGQWNFQSGWFLFQTTEGVPTISAANGFHYIAVGISGTQGLVKTGGGSLSFATSSAYTGVTTIEAGTLRIRNNASLGATGADNHTEILRTETTFGRLFLENNVNTAEDLVLRFTDGAAHNALVIEGAGTYGSSGTLTLDRAGASTGAYTFGVSVAPSRGSATLNLTGLITGVATGTQAAPAETNPNRLRFTANASSVINVSATIGDGTIGVGGVSLYKEGAGLLRLSGDNTYSGSTVHNAGVFLVNNTAGSGTGTGAVSVNGTAILGGVGIIAPTGSAGVVFASGTRVSPGDYDAVGVSGIGTLTLALGDTTGSALFSSGAALSFDIDAGTGLSDTIAFTGLSADVARVSFNNNTVNFTVTGGTLADGLYTLATFDAANAYSGLWSIGAGLEGYDAILNFDASGIQLQIGVIPEPSSAALLAGVAGLCMIFAGRRR